MTLTSTVRNWLMAVVAVALGAVAFGLPTNAADDPAGGQGTDTSLPSTDSEVTVSGRGAFSDLKITVNQTKDLTDQAISLTWTGGQPTIRNGRTSFAGNFLQVMQCWGDDDGRIPENPGPPPEQCAAGASTALYEGRGGGAVPANSATRRIISLAEDATYDPTLGHLDVGGNVWRRFRAVDGTVIGAHVNDSFDPFRGGSYWLNPYFDVNTTNEIAASPTRDDGTGVELFQTLTGIQSTGLGCGQRVLRRDNGEFEIPRCWLVVVPRGTPEVENAGTAYEQSAAENGVSTSPLSESAWANRIAIPLEFSPVDSPCQLSDDERRLAGNELVAPAVSSWQPLLCGSGQPPYSYAPVSDATARQILINPRPGSAGMVAISRPLPAELTNPTNPLVYAPVAASGIAIGFNIERVPTLGATPLGESLRGVRIENINLTPRLVAKLLTQSYVGQVEIYNPPGYEWLSSNPRTLARDPDFIRFNPEFAQLFVVDERLFSGLQLPPGTSDAARQVWEWILADPEAASWLGGEPDEWGMRVNPVYSTDPVLNPSGLAFGVPTPELFPKADPYCYVQASNGRFTPPALCGTDWMPYARNFDEAAVRVRIATDFARVGQNPFASISSEAWTRVSPQIVGRKAILGLTDTASAARYGLQTAGLSRAGDNGADRTFIEPSVESMTLGVQVMASKNEPQVVEPDPSAEAPGAYPLTTLTYAATLPLTLDAYARAEYSSFLKYVAGPGQSPGLKLGQLPRGYVPLSAELSAQTLSASEQILTMKPAVPEIPSPAPTVDPQPAVTTPPPSATPAPIVNSPTPPSSSSPSLVPNAPRPAATPSSAPAGTPVTEPPEVVDVTDPESTSEGEVGVEPESVERSEQSEAVTTPSTDVGPGRAAAPVLGGVALFSALAALELTKRPRRPAPSHRPDPGREAEGSD